MRSLYRTVRINSLMRTIKARLHKTFLRQVGSQTSRPDRDEWKEWFYAPQASYLFSAKVMHSQKLHQCTGILRKKDELKKWGPVMTIGVYSNESDASPDELFTLEAEIAEHRLIQLINQAEEGTILLLYVPHPFCSSIFQNYNYLPTWRELFEFFDSYHQVEILQYSPGIDPAGRYVFIVRKRKQWNTPHLVPEFLISRQTFRVFYFPQGADLAQGRSNYALSAHLCHALVSRGATVYAYSFEDMTKFEDMDPGDILIGHVGPWVREAYDRGFRRIILYNPANRWYPTRHSSVFEKNATLEEQVRLARMVIAQSGSIWRLTARYPDHWKWRWIDLGVDRCLFPRIKTAFAPPGKRRFCAINLYNTHEKGKDIAEELAKKRPDYRFTWIAGEDPKLSNVKYYRYLPNTSDKFREVVASCDFLLAPSREDAQAGTIVEAMSLGLIPVVSYASGYSIGIPKVMFSDSIEEWLDVIDFLQQVSEDFLLSCRSELDRYLAAFHNWSIIENQICFYIREYLARFDIANDIGHKVEG
jgi:hypothetical protein